MHRYQPHRLFPQHQHQLTVTWLQAHIYLTRLSPFLTGGAHTTTAKPAAWEMLFASGCYAARAEATGEQHKAVRPSTVRQPHLSRCGGAATHTNRTGQPQLQPHSNSPKHRLPGFIALPPHWFPPPLLFARNLPAQVNEPQASGLALCHFSSPRAPKGQRPSSPGHPELCQLPLCSPTHV